MGLRNAMLVLAVCGSGTMLMGQAPGGDAAAAVAPSAILQPAIDVLKQAVGGINVERWKASPVIKNEAPTNLHSVQHDLDSTMPELLAVADAAPSSPAKVLPVYRNAEALYDVMLRLVAAGRLAAPADQQSGLDQALAKLDDGRRALGEQLQADADGQEKKVGDLQAALKAIPPPAPPVAAPVCPAAAPAKKKVVKPAVKPGTPPAGSQ